VADFGNRLSQFPGQYDLYVIRYLSESVSSCNRSRTCCDHCRECNSIADNDGSNTGTQTSPEDSQQSEQQNNDSPTFGNFYVGNANISSSTIIDGRAEVVYTRPDTATDKLPVVMVPGLGLSPYIYRTTPDGRRGWMEYFAEAGHPVYVFNPLGTLIQAG